MIRQVWMNNNILAGHAYDDKTLIYVSNAAKLIISKLEVGGFLRKRLKTLLHSRFVIRFLMFKAIVPSSKYNGHLKFVLSAIKNTIGKLSRSEVYLIQKRRD